MNSLALLLLAEMDADVRAFMRREYGDTSVREFTRSECLAFYWNYMPPRGDTPRYPAPIEESWYDINDLCEGRR